MTFEKLAKVVADDFNEAVIRGGFESFGEMRRSYDWEMSDIKDEVRYITDEFAKESGEDCWMADDNSFIVVGFDDMSWGNFRKLFMQFVK